MYNPHSCKTLCDTNVEVAALACITHPSQGRQWSVATVPQHYPNLIRYRQTIHLCPQQGNGGNERQDLPPVTQNVTSEL